MGPERRAPHRILLVCTHWRRIGGSERYALWLADRLVDRGHDTLVVHETGTGQPRPGRAFLKLASTTYDASLREQLAGFRAQVVLILTPIEDELFELLLELAPVVRFVQDHTLFCPGLDKMHVDGEACHAPLGQACLQAATAGPPCHGLSGQGRLGRAVSALWRTILRVEQHRRAAAWIVASEWMRWELARLGFGGGRLVRLGYPLMVDGVKPTGDSGSLPGWLGVVVDGGGEAEDPPLVLTPARLALPDKGLDRLLDALARLPIPFQSIIAGDGPDRAALEARARRAGLSARVHFTGWLDDDRLQPLYRAARVVALPSIWDEPFGLVGLEAMAHAKAVLAFDVGGVREWLVPGQTGEVVPRGDVRAFAAKLEDLLLDPERARALGQAGRERVQAEFDPDSHLQRLESILEAAASGRWPAVGLDSTPRATVP